MMEMITSSRVRIATTVTLFFHVVGLVGILFINRHWFNELTPLNLLLSLLLLWWTQEQRNRAFYVFVLICYITGFAAEYAGVNHQLLFGSYEYGTILGPKWQGVPLMIGINWVIMMLCCGNAVQRVLNAIWNRLRMPDQPARTDVGFWAIVLDGALLATFFDWVMEPVAVELDYWRWLGDGSIPLFNYLSWFGVSALLMLIFRLLPLPRNNQFALNLLLIQLMFFLILRTAL